MELEKEGLWIKHGYEEKENMIEVNHGINV